MVWPPGGILFLGGFGRAPRKSLGSDSPLYSGALQLRTRSSRCTAGLPRLRGFRSYPSRGVPVRATPAISRSKGLTLVKAVSSPRPRMSTLSPVAKGRRHLPRACDPSGSKYPYCRLTPGLPPQCCGAEATSCDPSGVKCTPCPKRPPHPLYHRYNTTGYIDDLPDPITYPVWPRHSSALRLQDKLYLRHPAGAGQVLRMNRSEPTHRKVGHYLLLRIALRGASRHWSKASFRGPKRTKPHHPPFIL